MHRLSFSISTLDMGKTIWPEIMAEVDGRPLGTIAQEFELAHDLLPASGYGGLCPLHACIGSWDGYFHGYNPSGMSEVEKVALLSCNCGILSCWPLLAVIETDFETVVWKDFENPHRRNRDYSGLGPFVFDWDEYEEAILALQARVKQDFPAEASQY